MGLDVELSAPSINPATGCLKNWKPVRTCWYGYISHAWILIFHLCHSGTDSYPHVEQSNRTLTLGVNRRPPFWNDLWPLHHTSSNDSKELFCFWNISKIQTWYIYKAFFENFCIFQIGLKGTWAQNSTPAFMNPSQVFQTLAMQLSRRLWIQRSHFSGPLALWNVLSFEKFLSEHWIQMNDQRVCHPRLQWWTVQLTSGVMLKGVPQRMSLSQKKGTLLWLRLTRTPCIKHVIVRGKDDGTVCCMCSARCSESCGFHEHLPADPSGPSLVRSRVFFLVGSLNFLSPSLSRVSKTFSLPSRSLYLCGFLPTHWLPLTLQYKWRCKKGFWENKMQALQCICCHQCHDLIFFKFTLTHGNISQFPRARVIVAFALLCCELERRMFHFTTRAQYFATGLSILFHRWACWHSATILDSQRTTHHHPSGSQMIYITGFKNRGFLVCSAHSMSTWAQLTIYINNPGTLRKNMEIIHPLNTINSHCKKCFLGIVKYVPVCILVLTDLKDEMK